MEGWRDLTLAACLFCGEEGPHRAVNGPRRSLRIVKGPSEGLQVWSSLESASLRCRHCGFVWHEIVQETTAV